MSKKTTLHVNYQEWHESGGDVMEGEDSDSPYASRNPAYRHWEVTDITLSNGTPYHSPFTWTGEVPEKLFVVWVRYHDGNTFGTTYGYGTVEGVFADAITAQLAVDSIRADQWNSPNGYCCWDGYFSGLDEVDYTEVSVRK
jgi:hypothetical protein